MNGIKTNTNTIFDQAELTVVNIWDLSCDSCKGEMEAGEIGREYAGKGVQILGIVRGVNADNESEAEAAAAEVNADYVQMIASEEMEKNVLSKYGDAPVTSWSAGTEQCLVMRMQERRIKSSGIQR
ncbi:hypothetical protein LAJLEIBI_02959 [[Clostridium] hylemonae DSM 15053]|uniref:hypothetical protein n=1 Tax=[Clostridium] hylemonae TaxID=89153 RepID=UPI0011EF6285|nr:hypothetical protein [[Clostridium] hylemonae]QEK18935.1 hypothetical protein LAJLEIBI_02959 [[Clostridium] hylemonae DSM 15053]